MLELKSKDLFLCRKFLAMAVAVLKLVMYDYLYDKWIDIYKASVATRHKGC